MTNSVLLIGGAGYIGPIVAEHLLSLGNNVRVLDNLTYQNGFSLDGLLGRQGFDFIQGDMGIPSDVERAAKGISSVILLAGLVGDPITKKYPEAAHQVNDISISSCLETLSTCDIDRLVFISTCSNYGIVPENQLADEETPLSPVSLYAKSKVEAERAVLSLVQSGKLNACILRFATAFGISPRMRFDLTVNEFVRDLFLGKRLEVYDPDTWRPYCHVQDFARIIELALAKELRLINGEVFNAGSNGNNFTKRQIIEEILKVQTRKSEIVFLDKGKDMRNYRVNFDKVRSILDFVPLYSVELGIAEILGGLRSGCFLDKDEKYGNYSLFDLP